MKRELIDPSDALPALAVGGARAERKHYFLDYYASIMTQLKKFPRRAYVELFAGPGRVRYEETGAFADGSPLMALRHPFTEFVYVELEIAFAGRSQGPVPEPRDASPDSHPSGRLQRVDR